MTLATSTLRSTADDFYIAHVLSMDIIDAAYSARVMRNLVTVDSVAGQPTNTKKWASWPAVAAAAVAENADISPTAISTGGVTITVGEVGVSTTISDVLQEDDIINGTSPYGAQLGKAVADKEDADIAALLSGFSNATGDTTNGLSVEDVIAAIRALEARDAMGEKYGVMHPTQFWQLGYDVMVTKTSPMFAGDSPQDTRWGLQGAYKGEFFGVPFFATTNVPTNTRTNEVYDGGIFSRQALGFLGQREPRVEFDRDASFRLTEIVVTARYGVGELVDSYGQVLYSRTTAT